MIKMPIATDEDIKIGMIPPPKVEERFDGEKGPRYQRNIILIGVQENPRFEEDKEELGLGRVLREVGPTLDDISDDHAREFLHGE